MDSNSTQKVSTLVNEYTRPVKSDQFHFETWTVIGILVISLIILKTMIYIKDKKRHGR